MTDQPTACRTTRHCADHGFCHRCTPSLDDATAHLVEAIDAAGIEYPTSSRVYAQLAATVRDAARTAARQTTGQDDTTPTPCSVPVACEAGGEPCSRHEREWSHADGEHELCGAECTAVGQPASQYPRQDGDLTVLGPEIFASADGQVISWRGLNYVPQVDAQPLAEVRRDIHEALVVLPAPEADRVRALVTRLEAAARAAVGQPAEAHDTEARMRQLILNCLTGRAVCGVPRPIDEATGLLDAYRAAVLREAADSIDTEAATGNLNAPEYGSHENVLDASALLRRMADGSQP